jgi:hemoglobin
MKEVKRDIEGKTDIKFFVEQFYGKVRQNDLLAPVFASRIPDGNWAEHLERMYDFWNAILFSKTGFQGNPMQKHLSLPIEEKHFTQWLALFRETIDESFKGPKAEEAKKRATSIAQIMNFKIASLRI